MQKIGEKSLFILAINRSAPHFTDLHQQQQIKQKIAVKPSNLQSFLRQRINETLLIPFTTTHKMKKKNCKNHYVSTYFSLGLIGMTVLYTYILIIHMLPQNHWIFQFICSGDLSIIYTMMVYQKNGSILLLLKLTQTEINIP